MGSLKVGDLVVRRSYHGDVLFKVVAITRESALLRGISLRVISDAPLDDLMPADRLPRSLERIALPSPVEASRPRRTHGEDREGRPTLVERIRRIRSRR